jgi:ankyrin repeat protein
MEGILTGDKPTPDSLQSVPLTTVLAEKIYEAKIVLEASLNASELVNERDAFGNTALILALKKKRKDVVVMLIDAGADITVKKANRECIILC